MRVLSAPLLAAVLMLAACGTPAADPRGSTASEPSATMAPPVLAVPAAEGPVTGVGTVLQTPDGPAQLCLGAVAESWPPQCTGVPLVGWDWGAAGPHEEADLGGRVTRWGGYAVTGDFDGRTLTVRASVPLALYDTVAPTPRAVVPPRLGAAGWLAVQDGVLAAPGVLSVDRPGDTGPVQLLVVHDDGSIQSWADASFGSGAVVVTSALR